MESHQSKEFTVEVGCKLPLLTHSKRKGQRRIHKSCGEFEVSLVSVNSDVLSVVGRRKCSRKIVGRLRVHSMWDVKEGDGVFSSICLLSPCMETQFSCTLCAPETKQSKAKKERGKKKSTKIEAWSAAAQPFLQLYGDSVVFCRGRAACVFLQFCLPLSFKNSRLSEGHQSHSAHPKQPGVSGSQKSE